MITNFALIACMRKVMMVLNAMIKNQESWLVEMA